MNLLLKNNIVHTNWKISNPLLGFRLLDAKYISYSHFFISIIVKSDNIFMLIILKKKIKIMFIESLWEGKRYKKNGA
jgi:hypothetical protein